MYGGGKLLRIKQLCDNAFARYETKINALEQRVNLLSAVYSNIDPVTSKYETKSVLCLGNSITKHSPKASIEWYSDWGMAASSAEKDYVHQLETMLKEDNPLSSVTGLNIASWERDFSCNLDSLIGSHIKGISTVVIRLGENVEDVDSFENNLDRLVSYVQKATSDIVITGCFWEDQLKDKTLFNVAYSRGIPFVPLSWIDQLYDVRPSIGDTLYDTNENLYKITKDFIVTHPNDKGMEMIARAIYNSL